MIFDCPHQLLTTTLSLYLIVIILLKLWKTLLDTRISLHKNIGALRSVVVEPKNGIQPVGLSSIPSGRDGGKFTGPDHVLEGYYSYTLRVPSSRTN
jgi:hypothetical protein